MNFQNKIKHLLFLSIIAFTSCEKIINVDIANADKKYVVEGNVSNDVNQPVQVKLSQTKNVSDDNSFVGVSGALVTIQVNNGIAYTLPEIVAGSGVYETTAFTGVSGNTYNLTVNINGNTFTSTSTMSQPVKLDTLTTEQLTFGGKNTVTIHPSYKDPLGLGNSYRFLEYVNGIYTRKVFVQNDELSDGLTITRPLIAQDVDIKKGDIVTVQMQCIDAKVYKYWYSLVTSASGGGGNQSASPNNPVSNISGGALGCFSAYTVSNFAITVP